MLGRIGAAAITVYASTYLVFFRFAEGLWPIEMAVDESKGFLGVTFVEWMISIAIYEIVQTVTRTEIDIPAIWIFGLFAVSGGANYYVLIHVGIGKALEKRLRGRKFKEVAGYYLTGLGVFVGAAALLAVALGYHRRSIGLA